MTTRPRAEPGARLAVLGAGRAVRGGDPSALRQIDHDHRVLDWLLEAFNGVVAPENVYFIGGEGIDRVESLYPNIKFRHNVAWAETGPVQSLSLVPLADDPLYVSYSDVVFRPGLVDALANSGADLVLGVDTTWRRRYDSRSRPDLEGAEKVEFGEPPSIGKGVDVDAAHAEYVGVIRLSPSAVATVRDLVHADDHDRRATIPDLIGALIEAGHSYETIDVDGDWAELNVPQDLARFVLGTKAESLHRLRPLVRSGVIGEQVSFALGDWRHDADTVVAEIDATFGDVPLIVRSSSLGEDSWTHSAAGAYESVLDVDGANPVAVRRAVEQVIASYDDDRAAHQILVQRMLYGVKMSGVVMTRTPSVGAPYYVINFDLSGSTEGVTAGDREVHTVYLHRSADPSADLMPQLGDVIAAVREVEKLVGHDSLDIEFAVTDNLRPHILQVRPIAIRRPDSPVDDDLLRDGLDAGVEFLAALGGSRPFLLGDGTHLSLMADWNPAEMIGAKPRRLAASLYRSLITDESWAEQRADYGYRDVRPNPLIIDLLGHPYVDTRVDFNSFVPAALDNELARRLVQHYLTQMSAHPQLHDKVEFDILFTCTTFDFAASSDRLRRDGFTEDDIEALRLALLDITTSAVRRCAGDVARIDELAARQTEILDARLDPLDRAHALLADVRRLWVPLFAHLARHGFVAVTLLRSLEEVGAISTAESEAFQASIRSVPSAMLEDAAMVRSGVLDQDEFVDRYGHLRPGSYDITSPNYAAAVDSYLGPIIADADESSVDSDTPFRWSAAAHERIGDELTRSGLDVDVESFTNFLVSAIEGREFGKFGFMRSISAALEALAMFGERHDVSRELLADVSVSQMFDLRGVHAGKIGATLRSAARRGSEEQEVAQALCLPALISDPVQLFCFEQTDAESNFVSRKRVQAEASVEPGPEQDLEGRIVIVRNADPGYDWLFARRIAGLITMYGGANSHMAIRAAEFELPAAIGVGEGLFEQLVDASTVDLDCAARQVRIIR